MINGNQMFCKTNKKENEIYTNTPSIKKQHKNRQKPHLQQYNRKKKTATSAKNKMKAIKYDQEMIQA